MASMENIDDYLGFASAVVPIYATTGHATTATAVNGSGYNRAAFILQTGAMDSAAIVEMELTKSATSGGTYTLVSDSTLTDIESTAGASSLFLIDAKVDGDKPYMKLRGTCGTARATVSAICLLYNPNGIIRASTPFDEEVKV